MTPRQLDARQREIGVAKLAIRQKFNWRPTLTLLEEYGRIPAGTHSAMHRAVVEECRELNTELAELERQMMELQRTGRG